MDDLYEQARAALDVNPAYGGTAWDYQRALRLILDLHKPRTPGGVLCGSCANLVAWPCPSAQIVLSSLGLSASTEESRA